MKFIIKAIGDIEADPMSPVGIFGGLRATQGETRSLMGIALLLEPGDQMSQDDSVALLAIGMLAMRQHPSMDIIGRAGELCDQMLRKMEHDPMDDYVQTITPSK